MIGKQKIVKIPFYYSIIYVYMTKKYFFKRYFAPQDIYYPIDKSIGKMNQFIDISYICDINNIKWKEFNNDTLL